MRLLLLLLGPTRCFGLPNDRFGLWLKRSRGKCMCTEPRFCPQIAPSRHQLCKNNDPSTVRRTAAGVLQRLLRNRGNILACYTHLPCIRAARTARASHNQCRHARGVRAARRTRRAQALALICMVWAAARPRTTHKCSSAVPRAQSRQPAIATHRRQTAGARRGHHGPEIQGQGRQGRRRPKRRRRPRLLPEGPGRQAHLHEGLHVGHWVRRERRPHAVIHRKNGF